jgi:hypothetical protein
LLGRVLYSGTHGGDFLDPGTARLLRGELGVLGRVASVDRAAEAHLRAFERQMAELVECALRVNKPIAF